MTPTAFAAEVIAAYDKADVPAILWAIDSGGHSAFSSMTNVAGAAWGDHFWSWLTNIGIWKTPSDALQES